MNPRVLLRSSRHPSSATTALPSQPRQLLRSSVSQTLVHRLLHSPGSGGGTGPSAHFQNSFLFASTEKDGGKTGKRGFSSATQKQSGGKKNTEGNGGISGNIGASQPENNEENSNIPEIESLPCSITHLIPMSSAKRKGKLLSTPSRTLKLLLPLIGPLANSPTPNNEHLVLLVNPQQNLSTLAQLIQAELPPLASDPPRAPRVSFKALKHNSHPGFEGGLVRWSSLTEIADFLHDAARIKNFVIEIEDADDIVVSVPSFKERSYFLRGKLRESTREIDGMMRLREECDAILQKGSRKIVVGGLFCMLGWLMGVYWLAFETTYGWDFISPVTYLASLAVAMSSYLFLNNNSNFLPKAMIAGHQHGLYESRGFDQGRWLELVDICRKLRNEILIISEQYDESWDERKDQVGGERVKRLLKDGDE